MSAQESLDNIGELYLQAAEVERKLAIRYWERYWSLSKWRKIARKKVMRGFDHHMAMAGTLKYLGTNR